MKVWVTRAEPGAAETARRLVALGHEPLVAPLLEVRSLSTAAPDLAGVAALAFTSANGVRAFASLSPARDLPVFAVGETTATAARQAGFAEVRAGPSDVAALAETVVAHRGGLAGTVLHVGAAELAGELVAALEAAGVTARTLAAYRTVAADPPDPSLLAWLCEAQAVLLHSPKAARRLAELARSVDPPLDLACVHLVGLSPACLAPLSDTPAAGRHCARAPNEPDLLALLEGLGAEDGAPPPRPILSPAVWILLALSALCILAGAAIGLHGPPHTASRHLGNPRPAR